MIEKEVPIYAFAAFGHPSRSYVEPTNSHTVFEGFWGASKQKFELLAGGGNDIQSITGTIGTTMIADDSCLK